MNSSATMDGGVATMAKGDHTDQDLPTGEQRILENISELVGKTPLVRLNRLTEGAYADVVVKLEFQNPAASVKDRIAKGMIEDAERKGDLIPGKSVIIEATSGNTGIALAMMASAKRYRLIVVMPNSTSVERRFMIRTFGAELVLTDAKLGVKAILKKAKELAKEIPNAWYCDQFDNLANQRTHYDTTGPEIWQDTAGKVDFFVAGVGTGGTVSGVGRYLKEKNPAVKMVAVEPAASAVLSGQKPGPHKIQGMGTGMIPGNVDRSAFDEIITVVDEEVFEMARALALQEAILSGISGGANVLAALQIAKRPENEGKLIVTVIPSGGERYISTGLFDHIRDECINMPITPVAME